MENETTKIDLAALAELILDSGDLDKPLFDELPECLECDDTIGSCHGCFLDNTTSETRVL